MDHAMTAETDRAALGLAVAREHIRWAYRRGMTRAEILASVGAAGYLKSRRGADCSLLIPLAAAWLALAPFQLGAGEGDGRRDVARAEF